MATARTAREPHSNAEWRLFGALDIGVSHDYASGLAEWALLRDHLQHFGLHRLDTACEIGCGAGRMTNATACDFREVHALDVSAQRIAQAQSAPNTSTCAFHLVGEPRIPLPDAVCDLVYSIHVFQHLANQATVDAYFREAFRVLRPGGVLLVHLPMVGAHGFSGSLAWTLAHRLKTMFRQFFAGLVRGLSFIGLGGLLTACSKLLLRLGLQRVAGAGSIYRVFSFVQVSRDLAGMGFQQIELRILFIRNGHESYVFARKPASDRSRTAR